MNNLIDFITNLGDEIGAGILVAIVAYISSLVLEKRIASRRRVDEAKRQASGQAIVEAQLKFVNQVLSHLPEESRERYARYLALSQRADGSFPEPLFVFAPAIDQADIDGQIYAKFSVLHQRLEAIERRFPDETTIEKIASVNDAIFATSLESLAETLKRIEGRMLTKWDVAKIVFQIIAAVGGLVSLVFAAIRYLLAVGSP